MTYHPDPAAAFTGPLGDRNRLAALPLVPARDVPGLLPDPRTDGPRWAITPPEYPDHHVQRAVCPSSDYCDQNGCTGNGCVTRGHTLTGVVVTTGNGHLTFDGQYATAYFMDEGAALNVNWTPDAPRLHADGAMDDTAALEWRLAAMRSPRTTPEARRFLLSLGGAVPADPERYERPRGWGRQLLAAGVVAMGLAALLVAYAALLPW